MSKPINSEELGIENGGTMRMEEPMPGMSSSMSRCAKTRMVGEGVVDVRADWGFLANKGTAPNESLDRICLRNGGHRSGPDALDLLDHWRDLPGVATDRLFMCCSVMVLNRQDITMRSVLR